MNRTPLIYSSLALGLIVSGCAHKEEVKPEPTPTVVATLEASPTPEPQAAVEEPVLKHYTVRKGDSLWTISAQTGVLGDPFRWPALYKQNRDEITDPDLIEASQDLTLPKAMSQLQINTAVQEAKDTPPYAPHTAAREPLPLKY
jgi:hypothetical protein